jgi:hypothetical protein
MPPQPKLMTEAQRVQQIDQLEECLLAACYAARKLLADDLSKLARGREARTAKALSLVAHRAQLAHGMVQELHR